MAKILIIKTSSLGDVVHMLPAVQDISRQLPDAQIDWLVEEHFAEVPSWHPMVHRVYPVALRRWRKSVFNTETKREIRDVRERLMTTQYDVVIDSQGLLKSAWVARWAQGKRVGYDWNSAREPLASLFYQQRFSVSKQRHAITRARLLVAGALGYSIQNLPLAYALQVDPDSNDVVVSLPSRYVVAAHGTSREDKEWPVEHWQYLIQQLAEQGIHTLLPWGNTRERERAEQLAASNNNVQVLPRSSLSQLAVIMQGALGVVGMDTGLMHVAAALDKPGVALYPVTQPALTGVMLPSGSGNTLVSLSGAETQDVAAVTQRFLQTLSVNLPINAEY